MRATAAREGHGHRMERRGRDGAGPRLRRHVRRLVAAGRRRSAGSRRRIVGLRRWRGGCGGAGPGACARRTRAGDRRTRPDGRTVDQAPPEAVPTQYSTAGRGTVAEAASRVVGSVVIGEQDPEWVIHRAGMGTTARLVVADPTGLPAAGAVLIEELAAIDAACSRFRPDSEISRVHAARRAHVQVGPLLAEAVSVALRAAELTNGAVDPTIGGAVRALGYDRDFAQVRDDDQPARPPVRRPGGDDWSGTPSSGVASCRAASGWTSAPRPRRWPPTASRRGRPSRRLRGAREPRR